MKKIIKLTLALILFQNSAYSQSDIGNIEEFFLNFNKYDSIINNSFIETDFLKDSNIFLFDYSEKFLEFSSEECIVIGANFAMQDKSIGIKKIINLSESICSMCSFEQLGYNIDKLSFLTIDSELDNETIKRLSLIKGYNYIMISDIGIDKYFEIYNLEDSNKLTAENILTNELTSKIDYLKNRYTKVNDSIVNIKLSLKYSDFDIPRQMVNDIIFIINDKNSNLEYELSYNDLEINGFNLKVDRNMYGFELEINLSKIESKDKCDCEESKFYRKVSFGGGMTWE